MLQDCHQKYIPNFNDACCIKHIIELNTLSESNLLSQKYFNFILKTFNKLKSSSTLIPHDLTLQNTLSLLTVLSKSISYFILSSKLSYAKFLCKISLKLSEVSLYKDHPEFILRMCDIKNNLSILYQYENNYQKSINELNFCKKYLTTNIEKIIFYNNYIRIYSKYIQENPLENKGTVINNNTNNTNNTNNINNNKSSSSFIYSNNNNINDCYLIWKKCILDEIENLKVENLKNSTSQNNIILNSNTNSYNNSELIKKNIKLVSFCCFNYALNMENNLNNLKEAKEFYKYGYEFTVCLLGEDSYMIDKYKEKIDKFNLMNQFDSSFRFLESDDDLFSKDEFNDNEDEEDEKNNVNNNKKKALNDKLEHVLKQLENIQKQIDNNDISDENNINLIEQAKQIKNYIKSNLSNDCDFESNTSQTKTTSPNKNNNININNNNKIRIVCRDKGDNKDTDNMGMDINTIKDITNSNSNNDTIPKGITGNINVIDKKIKKIYSNDNDDEGDNLLIDLNHNINTNMKPMNTNTITNINTNTNNINLLDNDDDFNQNDSNDNDNIINIQKDVHCTNNNFNINLNSEDEISNDSNLQDKEKPKPIQIVQPESTQNKDKKDNKDNKDNKVKLIAPTISININKTEEDSKYECVTYYQKVNDMPPKINVELEEGNNNYECVTYYNTYDNYQKSQNISSPIDVQHQEFVDNENKITNEIINYKILDFDINLFFDSLLKNGKKKSKILKTYRFIDDKYYLLTTEQSNEGINIALIQQNKEISSLKFDFFKLKNLINKLYLSYSLRFLTIYQTVKTFESFTEIFLINYITVRSQENKTFKFGISQKPLGIFLDKSINIKIKYVLCNFDIIFMGKKYIRIIITSTTNENNIIFIDTFLDDSSFDVLFKKDVNNKEIYILKNIDYSNDNNVINLVKNVQKLINNYCFNKYNTFDDFCNNKNIAMKGEISQNAEILIIKFGEFNEKLFKVVELRSDSSIKNEGIIYSTEIKNLFGYEIGELFKKTNQNEKTFIIQLVINNVYFNKNINKISLCEFESIDEYKFCLCHRIGCFNVIKINNYKFLKMNIYNPVAAQECFKIFIFLPGEFGSVEDGQNFNLIPYSDKLVEIFKNSINNFKNGADNFVDVISL